MNRLRFLAALVILAAAIVGPALAQRSSPQPSAAVATTETLSAVTSTEGWCVATNGTTTLDLAATAPARVTAAIKSRVRFVTIRFVAGATSTRVCHRLGGSLVAAACNALDADAVGVLTDGQSATYAVARDPVNGGLQAMEAQANAGSDGAVCVVVGY